MPTIHDSINLSDVQVVLRQRNYAFHSMRGVGLALTKPDLNPQNRFTETGRARRIHLIAVTPQHLQEILRYSQTITEAADQIEAIATGTQLAPAFARGSAPAPALDSGMIEKLVTARVQNEISKLVDHSQQAQSQQASQIAELQAQLAAAKEEIAKAQPKKTARKPRKNSVVSKAEALAKAGKQAASKLTPEQEQRLQKTLEQQSKESPE